MPRACDPDESATAQPDRGHATTSDANATAHPEDLRDALRRMARERGLHASLCPSEVARQFAAEHGGNWRTLMPWVREAASALACAGEVVVLQRGQVQDPRGPWRGPIRIRQAKDHEPG